MNRSWPHHTPSLALTIGVLIASALVLSACASGGGSRDLDGADAPSAADSANNDHGDLESAQELSEPQVSIVYSDATGHTRLLDLRDGSDRGIAQLSRVESATGDGRFFVAHRQHGGRTDVDVVDSGVWTVPHGDHTHSYRADPAATSTLSGQGDAQVISGARSTAVTFGGETQARILDRAALAAGKLQELQRFDVAPGATVVPFGDDFLVAESAGTSFDVRARDHAGELIAGVSVECRDIAGHAITRVGVVFGCADGALLITRQNSQITSERIVYPEGTDAALRATSFDNRAGRPATAAVAGEIGAWHLDTRTRAWTLIPTERPLLRVSAVGDDEKLVVAIDTSGRFLVLSAREGRQIAASEPLVAASAVDPTTSSALTLSVDKERAYITGPLESMLFELDFRDTATVTRSFALPISPLAAELVG